MLCYRDRTFCNAKCTTTDCPDNITPDVLRAATEWSKGFGFDGALMSTCDWSGKCPDYVPTGDKLLERNDRFQFFYPE